jgi:hypothetical protein
MFLAFLFNVVLIYLRMLNIYTSLVTAKQCLYSLRFGYQLPLQFYLVLLEFSIASITNCLMSDTLSAQMPHANASFCQLQCCSSISLFPGIISLYNDFFGFHAWRHLKNSVSRLFVIMVPNFRFSFHSRNTTSSLLTTHCRML